MKKEVVIAIKGLQYEIDKDDALEVISAGEYYYRNGKHYVLFDEIAEDEEGCNGITKSTIKISGDQIELLKKGANNVHMVFQQGQKNMTYYNTVLGNLLIGLDTTDINIEESEDKIEVALNYGLEVNYNFVSDCNIQIRILPRR